MKVKHQSLLGRFFHTFTQYGEIHNQGQVLARPRTDLYLVQFKSWLDGEDTDQELVTLDRMLGWKFYDTSEDMRAAYEKAQQQSTYRRMRPLPVSRPVDLPTR